MEGAYCAICERTVALDQNHVRVDVERVRTEDRNGRDDHILHPECWLSTSEDWVDPA